MKKSSVVMILAVMISGGVFSTQWLSQNAQAEQPLVAANAVSITTVAANGDSYSYVGSKKCKKCHVKQYKSWEDTKMAKAFDILKPGNSAEIKEKFHIDVNKDYTADPACLKCHTTGFGKSEGYATPNPDDKKAVRQANALEGIGCESCHGPGSEYIKVFDDIMKSKRTYKVEELHAAGLAKMDENTCKTCHNEESPTINPGDTFDYEQRKKDGTHEHIELKQQVE